jgi:hypothetical protein
VKILSMKRMVLTLIFLSIASIASGWHDETHLAVAKAAGYHKWYNSTGADMAKIKAGHVEGYNHFFDNPEGMKVTAEMVLSQAARYNDPQDDEGHLYGAIIASLREYRAAKSKGKYAEYHLAFCAHYIADLSQPLHNMPYDAFNRARHSAMDGTVDAEVLENLDKIRAYMYPIELRPEHFEEDLAKEVARIANLSRELGDRLKKEGRNMTKEEAYVQLGHSASLLKAILQRLVSWPAP